MPRILRALARLRLRPTRHVRRHLTSLELRARSAGSSLVPFTRETALEIWLDREDLRRSRSLGALLVVAMLCAAAAPAGVYRVTCKGIHKLSSAATADSCFEDAMLHDGHGRFLSSVSGAHVDPVRGTLSASAGGGSIRDIGYGGREATSVIAERFRLSGTWTGVMPVEITLTLQYDFEGDGESRLRAMLRSTSGAATRREHRAAIRMRHTGLGGAVLVAGTAKGRFEQPEAGRIARRATIEIKVVQGIDAAHPVFDMRADLLAYALPNLGSFDESLTSLVRARGELEISAPCPFRIEAPRHAVAWGAGTASPDPLLASIECWRGSATEASRLRPDAAGGEQ